MNRKILCRLLCVVMPLFSAEMLHAQGTAFTYQGQLNSGGSLAGGNYDFRFIIYNASSNGSPVSATLTNSAIAVTNGLFVTTLDFGSGIFTGTNLWLDIGVRTNGDTNVFTMLSPRQRLTPVPYAIFANSASNLLGSLTATQLVGTLPASAFAGYTNTVTLTNGANIFGGTFNGAFSGAFSGNGANLTNLNASQLTAGTVADARLSGNVALLNANQTFIGSNSFTGSNSFSGNNTFSGKTNAFLGAVNFAGTNMFTGVNTFTNSGNSFSGSFFGNGLVGWLVQTGTVVQAVSDTGYLLTNSQLVTVTLPTNANVGDIVRISGAGAGGWQIAQNTNQSILGNFSSFANSSWTLAKSLAGQWSDIASSADGTKLIATIYNGTIYYSSDSGGTWVQTNTLSASWESVACSSDGSKMVAAVYGGDVYTNTGNGWAAMLGLGTANWTGVASSSDGSKLVAVGTSGIGYSVNSGVTWAVGAGAPAASWSAVASSANGSNQVATINGNGIYISSNAGASWSQSGALSEDWVSVASSADGSRLAAAANNGGGIYTSSNFGSSWTQQTNAPASAAWFSITSSADGSKLAATVNGGGIYISINYGVTWTQQTNAPIKNWSAIASSSDGSKLAAVVNNATAAGVYVSQASPQSTTTIGTSGYLIGGQGSAVELQYIGNNQFMPVSFAGTIWAY